VQPAIPSIATSCGSDDRQHVDLRVGAEQVDAAALLLTNFR
jgi:hypothetical protein